jgi:hypothetical protein
MLCYIEDISSLVSLVKDAVKLINPSDIMASMTMVFELTYFCVQCLLKYVQENL